MKLVLCVGVLAVVIGGMIPISTAQSMQSQQGTIVSVQKQNVVTPPVRAGANPDHTPLQSQYYRYKVSVQLNCEVYDLRYESEVGDLPSEMSVNSRVPVRLEKKEIYLDFPGDTIKMRIVGHKVNSETACQQRTAK